ncbi:TPA: DinI family protein [Enterobacter kobei]|nr:DinI family protein [Enterobacter kobei]HCM9509618.1 DinI family protein [Enterobacter kobei]
MKIELTIDRVKKLPDGAIPALESELLKRLSKQFDDCQLTIKRASNDGLTVFGGDKKEVEHIVQETWESADEWFY